MTRIAYLAPAAFALMLAAPAFAPAQAADAPAVAGAAASASPASQTAPSSHAEEQRVEAHIKELHRQLRITAAEEPKWQQFANVMRDNAAAMDQVFGQRAQQFATMNAVENMESYAKIADAHAQHVQKLLPAFENLYNAMPEQQKQLTDQVFRANAEAHAQKRMQTGRAEH